jgi:hypothetical protein
MVSTAASTSPVHEGTSAAEVSLVRLYVLRATYLLMVVGLGATIVPEILGHTVMARGVIPSLLGGLWALAFLGLRYPLQMLPLLMFEFAWKAIWLFAYGLPQRSAGQMPPTFAEDFPAIASGVILMPLVIPWGYVWSDYLKRPGARWRNDP